MKGVFMCQTRLKLSLVVDECKPLPTSTHSDTMSAAYTASMDTRRQGPTHRSMLTASHGGTGGAPERSTLSASHGGTGGAPHGSTLSASHGGTGGAPLGSTLSASHGGTGGAPHGSTLSALHGYTVALAERHTGVRSPRHTAALAERPKGVRFPCRTTNTAALAERPTAVRSSRRTVALSSSNEGLGLSDVVMVRSTWSRPAPLAPHPGFRVQGLGFRVGPAWCVRSTPMTAFMWRRRLKLKAKLKKI